MILMPGQVWPSRSDIERWQETIRSFPDDLLCGMGGAGHVWTKLIGPRWEGPGYLFEYDSMGGVKLGKLGLDQQAVVVNISKCAMAYVRGSFGTITLPPAHWLRYPKTSLISGSEPGIGIATP